MNQEEKFKEMARRNDIARQLGLNVVLTNKAAELLDKDELLYVVRSFNKFNMKDDFYGWHDLGYFDWKAQRILWRIDYFDPTLTNFEDPLSETCKRVVTVMLASEY